MKEFTFTAYCQFGKGDSGETFLDVELTDKEVEELLHYGTQAEIYYNGFSRCEELKELYLKLYALAVDQMTEEMRDYGYLDEKYASDTNWRIDEIYPCGVMFPFEFENMLADED